MKTIFDQVDPVYINCVNGLCEHAEHKINTLWWLVPIMILATYAYKLHGKA